MRVKKLRRTVKGILPDWEIERLCTEVQPPMISPFISQKTGYPSRGLGSYGYDIALGHTFLFPKEGILLDPLDVKEEYWTKLWFDDGEGVIIQPHQHVLAESVEYFHMPGDVMGICFGKSTWARLGLIVNLTPIEAGWKGRLTLELHNATSNPIRLWVGTGIAQVIFFRGTMPPRCLYADLGGRYQGQEGVTLPKQ